MFWSQIGPRVWRKSEAWLISVDANFFIVACLRNLNFQKHRVFLKVLKKKNMNAAYYIKILREWNNGIDFCDRFDLVLAIVGQTL